MKISEFKFWTDFFRTISRNSNGCIPYSEVMELHHLPLLTLFGLLGTTYDLLEILQNGCSFWKFCKIIWIFNGLPCRNLLVILVGLHSEQLILIQREILVGLQIDRFIAIQLLWMRSKVWCWRWSTTSNNIRYL